MFILACVNVGIFASLSFIFTLHTRIPVQLSSGEAITSNHMFHKAPLEGFVREK